MPSSSHKQIKEWARGIAGVFARPFGMPQLTALGQWLQSLCAIDYFVLFIYQGDYRPLSFFDTFPADKRRFFIDDYQSGPYLLDPFYLACMHGHRGGLHSLRALAPDHFYRSEYYLTYYRRLGLNEEIAYFVELPEGACGALSLMRGSGSPTYLGSELALLECAETVAAQVVRATWALRQASEPPMERKRGPAIHGAFERFGAHLLTRREQQIVQLLLRGHSNQSVAEALSITPGTVKIHRKNLYAKLNIGSQAELFGLFIRELAGL